MKKYLLLFTALTVASSVQAVEINCATLPECADLGFTMSTSDCAGKYTLKCPFDNTKVFCGGVAPITCTVGSLLYDDLKCYNTTPSGKTAIAVVFNTSSKLAVALQDITTTKWHSNTTTFVGGTSGSVGQGKNNTRTVAGAPNSKVPNGALMYCNNWFLSGGSWFVPSSGELQAIYNNKSTINTAITNAGGTALENSTYWSSTELTATTAAVINLSNNNPVQGSKSSSYKVRCAIEY